MTEQWRFPRSKKKRIRAKWAKRPGNHRPIVMHPANRPQWEAMTREIGLQNPFLPQ